MVTTLQADTREYMRNNSGILTISCILIHSLLQDAQSEAIDASKCLLTSTLNLKKTFLMCHEANAPELYQDVIRFIGAPE